MIGDKGNCFTGYGFAVVTKSVYDYAKAGDQVFIIDESLPGEESSSVVFKLDSLDVCTKYAYKIPKDSYSRIKASSVRNYSKYINVFIRSMVRSLSL